MDFARSASWICEFLVREGVATPDFARRIFNFQKAYAVSLQCTCVLPSL
jgi:hypothetical protein